jgi:hypothetical protein
MSSWGTAHASATNKPKFLPTDETSKYSRADCYATNAGWVMRAGTTATGNSNASADPEILVAIGGLAGTSATTGLKVPTVTNMRYIIGTTAATDLTAGSGATLQVEITWDEGVTVATANPTLVIANGNQGSGSGRGPYTLVYTGTGSTANRKRFILASQTIAEDDILTIGGANIVLASSSTISDTVVGGTTVAASLVLSGLTAVTHTVLA